MRWILALLLLPLAQADAATLRVPSEYATVLAAMDAASTGDTVLVAPGEYTSTDDRIVQTGVPSHWRANVFAKPGVTLVGSGGAVSTILVGSSGPPAEFSANVFLGNQAPPVGLALRIEGFTLRGAGDLAVYGGDHCNVVIVDCIVDEGPAAVTVRQGSLTMLRTVVRDLCVPDGSTVVRSVLNSDWVIEDCLFERNEYTANARVLMENGSVASLPGTTLLRRCRFVENRMYGLLAVQQEDVLVEDCWFEGNWVSGPAQGSCINAVDSHVRIERNTFVGNRIDGFGGGVVSLGNNSVGAFVHNTVYGTQVDTGSLCSGLTIDTEEPVEFHSNVLSESSGGAAVYLSFGAPTPTDGCNVVWANSAGNFDGFDGYVPQPTDVEADPQFCDPTSLDFALRSGSLCLPGGITGCGQIGAWPEGCGFVSVEDRSWAGIKALYRREGVR